AVNRLTVVPLTVHPVFQIILTEDMKPSSCPLQVKVRADRLLPRLHVSPILSVMVGVNHREDSMMHVSILRATGDVQKLEFYSFSIRRLFTHHARPVACVTIVRQEQAIPVYIKHGDRIIGSTGS